MGEIFLSGLPYECNEEDIVQFLGKKRKIESIRISKWQDSGRCRGYAHVTLQSEKSLKKALEKNGQKLKERYIDVKIASGRKEKTKTADWNSKTKTVFVKNLPYEINEDEITKFFEIKCGEVKEVRIPKNWSKGHSKGFAYVTFDTSLSSKKALELDQTEFQNRKLFVDIEPNAKPYKKQKTGNESLNQSLQHQNKILFSLLNIDMKMQ